MRTTFLLLGCLLRGSSLQQQQQQQAGTASRRPAPSSSPLSELDHQSVLNSLGYIPPNVLGVAARSTVDGRPIVLRTYPLGGGASRRRAKAQAGKTPFPTLYWLSCDRIATAVSDLERRGFVREIEERVNADPELVHRMRCSHESYAKERWATLRPEDRALLLGEGGARGGEGGESDGSLPAPGRSTSRMVQALRDTGVAGTALAPHQGHHPDRGGGDGAVGAARATVPSLKCLHAHLAHFRSGGCGSDLNVVGEWTQGLLQDEYPWCL